MLVLQVPRIRDQLQRLPVFQDLRGLVLPVLVPEGIGSARIVNAVPAGQRVIVPGDKVEFHPGICHRAVLMDNHHINGETGCLKDNPAFLHSDVFDFFFCSVVPDVPQLGFPFRGNPAVDYLYTDRFILIRLIFPVLVRNADVKRGQRDPFFRLFRLRRCFPCLQQGSLRESREYVSGKTFCHVFRRNLRVPGYQAVQGNRLFFAFSLRVHAQRPAAQARIPDQGNLFRIQLCDPCFFGQVFHHHIRPAVLHPVQDDTFQRIQCRLFLQLRPDPEMFIPLCLAADSKGSEYLQPFRNLRILRLRQAHRHIGGKAQHFHSGQFGLPGSQGRQRVADTEHAQALRPEEEDSILPAAAQQNRFRTVKTHNLQCSRAFLYIRQPHTDRHRRVQLQRLSFPGQRKLYIFGISQTGFIFTLQGLRQPVPPGFPGVGRNSPRMQFCFCGNTRFRQETDPGFRSGFRRVQPYFSWFFRFRFCHQGIRFRLLRYFTGIRLVFLRKHFPGLRLTLFFSGFGFFCGFGICVPIRLKFFPGFLPGLSFSGLFRLFPGHFVR